MQWFYENIKHNASQSWQETTAILKVYLHLGQLPLLFSCPNCGHRLSLLVLILEYCRRCLGQYQCCWCLGSLHHQVTTTLGIDFVVWSGPCLPWANISTTWAISTLRMDKKMNISLCFLGCLHRCLGYSIDPGSILTPNAFQCHTYPDTAWYIGWLFIPMG